jgi:predicted HAD superfamily Cof-like phosphohydrolase
MLLFFFGGAVSVPTMMVSVLPDEWMKKHASDPGTKSMFEQLLKNVDHLYIMKKQNETELVRPFLSEPAWALYSAYHSFLSARLIKASLLTLTGIDHFEVLSRFNERDLVDKSASEEISVAYDKNPYAGTEPYLRFLRERILTEFREFLSGQRAGNQAIQDAAQILHAADDLAARSSASSREVQRREMPNFR